MTLDVRNFSMIGQFAKLANTAIPPIPISGQVYRDANLSKQAVETGQAYDAIGLAELWNQLLYMATGIAQLSENFGFVPFSPLTNYTGDASWCLGQDGIPYRCLRDCGPGDAAAPGVGPKPPPNAAYWESLTDYIKRTWSGGGGGGGGISVGWIDLLPYRASELPAGWYFCNGGGYSTTSAVGLALAGLSAAFKVDWGITVSGSTIYLPNLFSGNDGYFLRPVNNSNRYPGNKQADAIRNIVGELGWVNSELFQVGNGVFSLTPVTVPQIPRIESGAWSGSGARGRFDASSVVPTASENRPANIGMTPAIYLGV